MQQVSSEGSGEIAQPDLEESGEIVFKNDRQLKWTYLHPDYKVFLLDGDLYKFYDEDNEQLIIGKIKEKNEQWIWQLFFSDDIFPYARWDESRKNIHIENESENVDIDIEINSDFLPVKVVQEDPTGARIVYFFKEYRKKIEITGDTFRLNIPGDVEVVREDEDIR